MLATRTRDLMRFHSPAELPAGDEFAGKSVAAEIDGGQSTSTNHCEKESRQRQNEAEEVPGRVREAKVVILFRVDKKGRMVQGEATAFIDGTLQGPDALIELVAFSFAPNGGTAKANVVTARPDGALHGSGSGWIGSSPRSR